MSKAVRNSLSPISHAWDPNSPKSDFVSLPPRLERLITNRWKQWEPWVRMYLLRRSDYDPAAASVEFSRLRERHSDQLMALVQAGVRMRLVRRHRLDDPRLTDETRATLVRAVMERRRKARLTPEGAWCHLYLESWLDQHVRDARLGICGMSDRPSRPASQSPPDDSPTDYLGRAIRAIQERISDHFYLGELRDSELKVRSRRQVFALPRQVAMYIVRQLTAASLQEIGRQFGGRHHTTVLHSIHKIEVQRQSDKDLDRTLTQLLDVLQQK